MPYIKLERRNDLDVVNPKPVNAGELNYVLTSFVLDYLGLKEHVRYSPPHYQDYNDVLGVLTAMQLELYRRMIGPYEDEKIKENGDVY